MSKRAAIAELDAAARLLHEAHQVGSKEAADKSAESASLHLNLAASEVRLMRKATDAEYTTMRIDVLEKIVNAQGWIVSGMPETDPSQKSRMYEYARNTAYQAANRLQRGY